MKTLSLMLLIASLLELNAMASPLLCSDKELYRDLPKTLESMITKCFKVDVEANSLDLSCAPDIDPNTHDYASGAALCAVNFNAKDGTQYSLRDVETTVAVPDRTLIKVASAHRPNQTQCTLTGYGHKIGIVLAQNGVTASNVACVLQEY